jgi:hypothetical protein
MPIEENLFEQSQLQLTKIAKKIGVPGYTQFKGNDLVFKILEFQAAQEGLAFVTGCLEISDEGFGFLRFPKTTTSRARRRLCLTHSGEKVWIENRPRRFWTGALSQRGGEVLCPAEGGIGKLHGPHLPHRTASL